MNPADWAERLLRVSQRKSVDDEAEFYALVDSVAGKVSPEVASVLMQTFSPKEDYGTQEAVCSALASADEQVQMQAILREMPRLVREAHDWAESLICTALQFHFEGFKEALVQSSAQVRSAVHAVVSTAEFQSFQPRAVAIDQLLSGNA